MSSNVAQQKQIVEQLRVEYNIERKPVSACIKDMIAYMDENYTKDSLVIGFANKKDNPFQEKSGCTILWDAITLVYTVFVGSIYIVKYSVACHHKMILQNYHLFIGSQHGHNSNTCGLKWTNQYVPQKCQNYIGRLRSRILCPRGPALANENVSIWCHTTGSTWIYHGHQKQITE